MKKVKSYLVILFTIFIVLFLGSFIFFDRSFDVATTIYVPFEKFPLYVIENENVSIKLNNILITAAVFAMPVNILFSFISKAVSEQMKKKGRN